MENKSRILILEDSAEDAELIEYVLKKSGLNFVSKKVTTKAEYIKQLSNFLPNIVLSDHSMPGFNSIEALEICKKEDITIPFILVTGTVSEEFAVDCLKRGADDYVLKNNLTRLPSAIISATKKTDAENERIIALEMLSRSEEHFRKLIENSSDIIAIINNNNSIAYVSPSVFRILGFTPEEFKNKKVTNFITVNNFSEAKSLVEQHKNKVLSSFEIKIKHKNGTWRLLECISHPETSNQNGQQILNIRDITERKLAEQELKAKNEELLKINQELDRFVYSASHDLKAPLKSLIGLIKIAQIEFEQNKLSSFKIYANLMEKSIMKLDDTIQKILVHSANSRSEVTMEEIDFHQIIHEILDKLFYMEGNVKIEKKVIIDQQVPFYSDKNRITVILNNLISNAIKYSNLNIEKPYFEIRISITKQTASMIFEDNGIGIETEYLDQIFNMFFRATEKSDGSGLGLYIVKEIVEKLSGTIKVLSKISEGTTFVIKLPNKLKS